MVMGRRVGVEGTSCAGVRGTKTEVDVAGVECGPRCDVASGVEGGGRVAGAGRGVERTCC